MAKSDFLSRHFGEKLTTSSQNATALVSPHHSSVEWHNNYCSHRWVQCFDYLQTSMRGSTISRTDHDRRKLHHQLVHHGLYFTLLPPPPPPPPLHAPTPTHMTATDTLPMTSVAEDLKSPPPPPITPTQPTKSISQGTVFNVVFVTPPTSVAGQDSSQKSSAGTDYNYNINILVHTRSNIDQLGGNPGQNSTLCMGTSTLVITVLHLECALAVSPFEPQCCQHAVKGIRCMNE